MKRRGVDLINILEIELSELADKPVGGEYREGEDQGPACDLCPPLTHLLPAHILIFSQGPVQGQLFRKAFPDPK